MTNTEVTTAASHTSMSRALSLNAELNLYGPNGEIQFDKDAEAVKAYFLDHVNQNYVFFHSLRENLNYLIEEGYYEPEFLDQYKIEGTEEQDYEFIRSAYRLAYSKHFRFPGLLGAQKFYSGYAMKTFSGDRWLERYEDRVVVTALYLARGNKDLVFPLIEEMMSGRFQPATPTFLNAGKKSRGELVSCFPGTSLVDTDLGAVRIDEIKVGDKVLSHDGEYHAVTSVMSRQADKGLVTLSIDGLDQDLISTPEHPVLAYRSEEASTPLSAILELQGKDGSGDGLEWVAAKDILPGDYVAVSRLSDVEPHMTDTMMAGQIILEVTGTSTQEASLEVYNLEVADTHTYSVHGVIVHNCFLLRVEDNMESIARAINSSLQLSKRGGGVALNLSNLRATGDPLKNMAGLAKGVIPVMKLLENSFQYADQLGQRPGAGAVYLSALSAEILPFLDSRRENADERIRIKTLSLGVVVPDIIFELAKNDEWMYTFSPYDVEKVYGIPFGDMPLTEKYREMKDDPRIRKRKDIKARAFLTLLAEVQFESGYPYVLFEDTATNASPIKTVKGKPARINMSNLCSEIIQVNSPSTYDDDLSYDEIGQDISCNLGSMNIAAAMDGGDIGRTVEAAIRALTAVSEMTSMRSVRSVEAGNEAGHAIGLGQMNLHGYLARERIFYGSEEGVDFTNIYFYTVAYHAIKSSNKLAIEKGKAFDGFEESTYADGTYFDKYVNDAWVPATEKVAGLFEKSGIVIPTQADWAELRDSVMAHGIFNRNLQAVPPTGSISYINNSTASIHPISAKVEIRKEGKLGRLYYPAPFMTQDNQEYYQDAYEIGPEKLIDTYAAAQQHVDQGLSLTLFFPEAATTRDVNKAQMYAWKKGIKTIYYVRIRQAVLEGTEVEGCVSCAL